MSSQAEAEPHVREEPYDFNEPSTPAAEKPSRLVLGLRFGIEAAASAVLIWHHRRTHHPASLVLAAGTVAKLSYTAGDILVAGQLPDHRKPNSVNELNT